MYGYGCVRDTVVLVRSYGKYRYYVKTDVLNRKNACFKRPYTHCSELQVTEDQMKLTTVGRM